MELPNALEESGKISGLTNLSRNRSSYWSIFSGKDVFVSLPTGYGKSIIYAILPTMFDKLRGSDVGVYNYVFIILIQA